MSSAYVYRKPVRRTRHAEFRRRMIMILLVLIPFAAVGAYIYLGFHNTKQVQPVTSAIENTQITGNKSTFYSDYFQFQDTDTWVFDKHDSTATQTVFHKFRKNIMEAELIVYINHVPIPLYLATPRVLPVRIVNANSFAPTVVSTPCGQTYGKTELHKVKELNIGFATMLCDPDSPQYFVQLSEVGGNYQLNLKRPNGQQIQFVITYKDTGLNPQPDAIMNIASSFKTR